jgi:hypothetical protein
MSVGPQIFLSWSTPDEPTVASVSRHGSVSIEGGTPWLR